MSNLNYLSTKSSNSHKSHRFATMSDIIRLLAYIDLNDPKSAQRNKSHWESVSESGKDSDKVYANMVLDMLKKPQESQASRESQAWAVARNPPTKEAAVMATYTATGNRTLAVMAGMSYGLKGICKQCKQYVAFGSKCCGQYCTEIESMPSDQSDQSDPSANEDTTK